MSVTHDKYAPLQRKGILSYKIEDDPIIDVNGVKHKTSLFINASYDKYGVLLEAFKNGGFQYPLCIVLYDETIANYSTIGDKMKLFSILNLLPIDKIRLELSDSNFALYNLVLNRIGWIHDKRTYVQLTLDRNPVSSEAKKEMHIEDTPGYIYIPDQKLIWFTNKTLTSVRSRIGKDVVDQAIELKRDVKKYCYEMDSTYDLKHMDDFGRTYLAYKWISENIEFPERYTYYDENGMQRLKINAPKYISEPHGTFKYKEGVCSGQASLMKAFLNNPCMKVDAVTLAGWCPFARHAWVGINIDGYLYECCTTMEGPFKPLSKLGYELDESEIYPIIYRQAHLSEKDREYIKEYTDSLKLKKRKW